MHEQAPSMFTGKMHAALRTAAPPRQGIKACRSWTSWAEIHTNFIDGNCSALCHCLDLLIIAKVDAGVKPLSLLPSTSNTALLVVFAL
jgi:hypothetical protein